MPAPEGRPWEAKLPSLMQLRYNQGSISPIQIMTSEVTSPDPTGYEPPCIEKLLEAKDLEREVLYAGGPSR